jgi:hypothetical protein
MDPVLLILVCAVAGLGWWWYQKRQPKPVEDEWVLPSASEAPAPHLMARSSGPSAGSADGPSGAASEDGVASADPGAAITDPAGPPEASPPAGPPASEPGIILDREFLLKRDRTFDPRNWDNSPDPVGFVPGEAEVEGDFPKFFDREYLENRARERGQDDPA